MSPIKNSLTKRGSPYWLKVSMLVWLVPGGAAELSALPVAGRAEMPALLLELGQDPPSSGAKDTTTRVFPGEVTAHEGDASIQTDRDEVASLHPGFGSWSVAFRFNLKPGPESGPYTFWAHWRQGGEPDVCVQTFEIWAGPDPSRLERRAALRMKPKGWDYAWVASEPPLTLKADDTVIEVRDSGSGHDAKIFDAFLLGPPPPPANLPVAGTAERPVVLLDLGETSASAPAQKGPAIQVHLGKPTAQPGADSVSVDRDEVVVFHKGFGAWGATFRFDLKPAIAPGLYRFFARYKSGGEVSQVLQTFTVKAGADPKLLASRGAFELTNTTPWEYQWVKGASTVALLPGDAVLQIENAGKADGAKVFDAFLLKLETPLGDWMSAQEAQVRNRFLALAKAIPDAEKQLHVLDGKGERGETLFRGLAADTVRSRYDKLQVHYLVGPDAQAMANGLNLPGLPAAVLGDDHHTLLGALVTPKDEAEVARFLADPGKAGMMPAITPKHADAPTPLRNGVPDAWLVGGLQDGLAGVSIYGLDTETVLRPNPGQPYLSTQMMGGEMRRWRKAPAAANGVTVIEAATTHSYGWSRGTGYGQLYLHVDRPTQALLHLRQSGIKTAGWLDGRPLSFADDPHPPADFPTPGDKAKTALQGLTTEGLRMSALPDRAEGPQVAVLDLAPGWHSLLVKLAMQHDQGQSFLFAARFTDEAGHPLDSIRTQLTDPGADLALNEVAGKLRPLVYADAPANLPHPGDALRLRVDLRWHPIQEERALTAPLPRFRAKLRVRVVDYQGKEIAVREIAGLFPGAAVADLGKAPQAGYYAVYPSLHTPEGKLIMAYPADGFTVVRGGAAQKERLERKKLWNNDYYAFADGDQGFRQEGGYFDWLERMGVYMSYGSYPGFEPKYRSRWESARRRGLIVFADTAGDSDWLNDNPEDGRKFIATAAPFTRFFKASNEIDIRREAGWLKLREPAHWVDRAKWEYGQVHQARSDGHYVGGSLVRPGDMDHNQDYTSGLGAGRWFAEVLKLGLDQYQDAWDVHAYPQNPPRFGGPIGNSETEDERGVLAVYSSLGRKNTLPFWLGETGAKAAHGYTGRRWQAEQTAKMIAWVNSRTDYLGIAFCIGHEYDWGYGRIWDYSMGHKPGEAALYTAGALIDGLPYKAVEPGDPDVQAAYFGETFMIWRTDDGATNWPLQRDPSIPWVVVDVVGHAEPLAVGKDGKTTVRISASPLYVLAKADYERLTRYR
jgi:hypothetical protein